VVRPVRQYAFSFAACIALVSLVLPGTAKAQARPTLAGTWSAGPMIERWNVGMWGTACGPQPAAKDYAGGQVTIREEGSELVITGVGRTFRTSDCWELPPGAGRSGHSASARSWQTGCANGANDPRHAKITTSIRATDSSISLDETGEYHFRLEGQDCTASARRSRTYALLQRQGEAPAATAAPAPTAAATQPAPAATPAEQPAAATPAPRPAANRCTSVVDPARIEVKPARKLMRPGEHFAFRAQVVDANGCPVDVRPTWAVATPGAKASVTAVGMVAVADDAADGSVDILASVGGKAVKVTVEVATSERYEALLATATSADAGAFEESAMAIVATGNLGSHASVAEDAARARKRTFVMIIGGLALMLAVLGVVLLRRAGRGRASAGSEPGSDNADEALDPKTAAPSGLHVCPSCKSEFPPGRDFCPRDGNRLVPAAPTGGTPVAPGGGLCPTCGRGYDPGVKVCPTHGEDLVPAPVHRAARKPSISTPRGKICPVCGGRYGADAEFCGKDGAALVLVN
jgi:hypothetical protein